MKKSVKLVALVGACILTGAITVYSCTNGKTSIRTGLRFCESTLPYEGGILIANFGSTELNPINNEGKGYILNYKNEKIEILIPADGNLSAPKGMYQQDGYLYICDVNNLVIYNLKKLNKAPQIIIFPEGDIFLNDLVAANNQLYISVTNSNNIYRLDISKPAQVGNQTPTKWLEVAGPNGLLMDGNTMYIASYPADGKTTEHNIVYKVTDLNNPVAEPFFNTPGQYDGIALSANKATLYLTNWAPAGVTAIDMKSGNATPVLLDSIPVGPADITIEGDMLYIPDLPNSRLLIHKLK